MKNLDFLADDAGPEDVTAEPAAAPNTPPAVEPPASPAAQPAQAAQEAAPATAAAAATPEPPAGHVPLSAMQAERARRQAAEAELARYRQQPAGQAQPATQQPVYEEPEYEGPDPNADPVAYAQAMHESLALDMSERFAAVKYGPDLTEQAKAWAREQGPYFLADVRSRPDPYDYLVQVFQNYQIASEISTVEGQAAFRQWKATLAQTNPAAAGAVPAASVNTAPPPPPQSQAGAPSAGNGTKSYLSDADAFDGAFKKRR